MKTRKLVDAKVGDILEGRHHMEQYEVLSVDDFHGRKPMFLRVRRLNDGELTYLEGRRNDTYWLAKDADDGDDEEPVNAGSRSTC